MALTIEAMHAEVAELHLVGEPALAVRADETSIEAGTITFTTDVLTVMISVHAEAGRVRVDGWAAPAGELSVELHQGGDVPSTTSDVDGRFSFSDIERGPARLVLRRPSEPDGPHRHPADRALAQMRRTRRSGGGRIAAHSAPWPSRCSARTTTTRRVGRPARVVGCVLRCARSTRCPRRPEVARWRGRGARRAGQVRLRDPGGPRPRARAARRDARRAGRRRAGAGAGCARRSPACAACWRCGPVARTTRCGSWTWRSPRRRRRPDRRVPLAAEPRRAAHRAARGGGGARGLRGVRPARAEAGFARLVFKAEHNLGYLSFVAGRLPEALAVMEAAAAILPGPPRPTALQDRARVLLEAGLVGVADAPWPRRPRDVRRQHLPRDVAECELGRAECAMLRGRPRRRAGRSPLSAERRFRRRGDDGVGGPVDAARRCRRTPAAYARAAGRRAVPRRAAAALARARAVRLERSCAVSHRAGTIWATARGATCGSRRTSRAGVLTDPARVLDGARAGAGRRPDRGAAARAAHPRDARARGGGPGARRPVRARGSARSRAAPVAVRLARPADRRRGARDGARGARRVAGARHRPRLGGARRGGAGAVGDRRHPAGQPAERPGLGGPARGAARADRREPWRRGCGSAATRGSSVSSARRSGSSTRSWRGPGTRADGPAATGRAARVEVRAAAARPARRASSSTCSSTAGELLAVRGRRRPHRAAPPRGRRRASPSWSAGCTPTSR